MSGPRPDKPPTQKRLACDRCHARKLRCLRERSTARCSRCVQDGFACTYSPPLKCGRPRKASLAMESSNSHGQQWKNSPSAESTASSSTPSDTTSNSTNAPLPDLTHINTVSELMYTATPDTDLLYHIDSAGCLTPTSSSSADPMTLGSSSWLDSLIHNQQLIIPDQSPEKGPEDSNRDADEGHTLGSPGLGQPEPMVLTESGVSDGISDVVQTLCRLQQELVQLRQSSHGDGGELSTISSYQTSLDPVDTVLRPGQELVATVRRLFDECTRDQSTESRRQLTWDRQTLLPLIFTPLSLLLSTYGEMLSHHRIDQVNHDRPGANPSLTASSSSRERREHQHQHQHQ
ncbi:hypothetical protein F4677DRAFT_420761, partial [Hypoxylon crocopeplum]